MRGLKDKDEEEGDEEDGRENNGTLLLEMIAGDL